MLPLGLQIPEHHPQEAFFGFPDLCSRASLVAQFVKNLPAMQEARVGFLGLEDPLEKGYATYPSVFGLPLWLSW